VPVLADDTPASLAARVLRQEHRIFPQAVAWIAAGRVDLRVDNTAAVRGVPDGADAALISPSD
jgi:phosphoribosylglycinamide formyltransferase-1